MKVEKAAWVGHEDNFTMSMSVCKVDQEQRMVHGWATLDNPDRQGDVVEASASEKAFSRFRGNIREMHEKIAAGRMVGYRPQTYVDPETNEAYNGFFVSAYVSKGAQPTWEKVLDGTLNAFSIKGPVYEYEHRYNEKLGKTLRHILDYDLEELSLVDSGGNQLANVVSIQKNAEGEVTVSGMYDEVKVENIFLCTVDKVAETSPEESLSCQFGHEMKNIGWVEANDTKSEVVAKAVNAYFDKSSEGGVEEMADTKVEKAAEVDEVETEEVIEKDVVTEEVVEAEPVVEETVEKADDEAGDEEEVVEKAAEVEEKSEFDVEKSLAEVNASISKLADLIAAGFTTLADGVSKSIASVEEKTEAAVNEIKEELGEVSKSVDGLEEETALKKSGDLGGSSEPVKKAGVWQGSIL